MAWIYTAILFLPTLVAANKQRFLQQNSLDAILNMGNYSSLLYGGNGRVPQTTDAYLGQLRFIWWGLLTKEQKEDVQSAMGVCKKEAHPSAHMLFAPLSMRAEPPGAVWYHQDEDAYHPVPSQSYVEVTHCAKDPGHGPCVPSNFGMWFYAAPGSGVSVNVGKTKDLGRISMAVPVDSKLKEYFNDPAGYDSLQLWHQDSSAREEWRHEIIFDSNKGVGKGWNECIPLNASFPGLQCGRAGFFVPFSEDYMPLQYLSNCKQVSEEATVPTITC